MAFLICLLGHLSFDIWLPVWSLTCILANILLTALIMCYNSQDSLSDLHEDFIFLYCNIEWF